VDIDWQSNQTSPIKENIMSTISQTPKINTARTLDARNATLLIIAALAVALVAVFANRIASGSSKPVDASAYMLYRQSEWLSVPIPSSHTEAYQIFRQAEVTSPVSNAQAYQLFRRVEITSVPVVTNAEAYRLFRISETISVPVVTNAEAYHLFRLGEWVSVNAPAGTALDLAVYHSSERTLVVPLTGMEIYLTSEHTSIPARFGPYQRSEWFGR
jgi:hypothetical protein